MREPLVEQWRRRIPEHVRREIREVQALARGTPEDGRRALERIGQRGPARDEGYVDAAARTRAAMRTWTTHGRAWPGGTMRTVVHGSYWG